MDFLELGKEILVSLGVHKALQKTASDATVEGGKFVIKKIRDDHRAELLAIIANMKERGMARNIWRRYEETLPENGGLPEQENKFVTLLSRFIIALKNEPTKDGVKNPYVDVEKALQNLDKMTDEDFKKALYFLENDSILQFTKKILMWANVSGEILAPEIKKFREFLAEGGVKK